MLNGQRLTHSQIKPVREQLLAAQGGKCAICSRPINPDPNAHDGPVLDHCHRTGAVRATLHRSCNSILGKVENAIGRFGLTGHFIEWAMGLGKYLLKHKPGVNHTGYIYPTHKSEDEKRVARNKKQRTTRARAKTAFTVTKEKPV